VAAQRGLTGFWTGVYHYPRGDRSTPFHAYLEEAGGAVTGTIVEPDKYKIFGVAIALSLIDGARDAGQLSFRKVMQNGRPGHTILYTGAIDLKELRITGRWTIPGNWSGAFSMQRDEEADALSIERAETVEA
jgi:hypothetical protein